MIRRFIPKGFRRSASLPPIRIAAAAAAAVESLEPRQLLSVSFDTYLIGPGDVQPLASAADAKGNVYVLGTFTGTVDFNPAANKTFNVNGDDPLREPCPFVAKYSASGGLYWVLPFRGESVGTGFLTVPDLQSIAVDSSGSIFLGGRLRGTIDADPGRKVRIRESESDFDVIVMKFGADTRFMGATNFTLDGQFAEDATQLKVDNAGNAYVAGTYDDGGYVAKVSARGNFAWWNNTPDSNDGVALGIDRNQNPVLVGRSGTTAAMGLTRYNAAGRFVSHQLLTSSASATGVITPVGIDFDSSNNPLVAGNLTGFADFDPSNASYVLGPKLSSDQSSNIFFAEYTPRGKLNFARLIGSTGQDAAAGIHIDPKSGNFYLAGAFDGPVDFDPGRSGVFVMDTGRHAEPSDLFVATYTHLGAFINAAQLGAPGTIETPISFSLAPSGRVYVLGKSESSGGSESISLFDTIR